MSRFDEAMSFLLGSGVTLYTNAERAEAPCPACGATQGRPCLTYRGSDTKRTEAHEERRNFMTPRSDDELLDLLEKLARQYARPHNPMESYGPARYQRAPKPAPFTPPKGFTKEGGVYVVP